MVNQAHHVYCDDHRDSQLPQLGCQIQVCLKVRSGNDVQNNIRTLFQEIVSCNNLLGSVGGKGIDSRKIRYGDILVFFSFPSFFSTVTPGQFHTY